MANISNVLNFNQDVSRNYNPSFNGLVPNKPYGRALDPRRRLGDLNNYFSLAACLISVIGFGVGGPALIYDYNYKKHHPQEGADKKPLEYGHFESATKIGKIGLRMNQMALTVSGFAGATGGLALGVPLQAAGEFIGNVVAAPVINTPIGYGLLNIGLAAIFGARAFDTDPSHKAKMALFMSKKGAWDKTKYVLHNMGQCMVGAANSSTELAKNAFHLCSFDKVKRSKAWDFFTKQLFSIRSSTLNFVQEIDAHGNVKVATKLKSNPHVLLLASSLLALAGVFVIGVDLLKKAGVIKSDKPTKAGFVAGKTGQIFDNYGITSYGMDRFYKGNKVAGIATVVSGATMMAGAPNADNDFGKGLTWFGLSAFFLFMAAERFQGAAAARKGVKAVNEYLKAAANHASQQELEAIMQKHEGMFDHASAFVRQFEIDLSHVYPRKGKYLNRLRESLGDKDEDTWTTIKKTFFDRDGKKAQECKDAKDKMQKDAVAALKADGDPRIKRIPEFIDFVNGKLAGQYNPKYGVEQLKADIRKEFPGFEETIVVRQVNHEDAIREAIYSNIMKSGRNYKPELEQLAQSQDPVVRDVAAKCKQDYQQLLEVE